MDIIKKRLLRNDSKLKESDVLLMIETQIYSSITKVSLRDGIDKYYKILAPYIEDMNYKKLLICAELVVQLLEWL